MAHLRDGLGEAWQMNGSMGCWDIVITGLLSVLYSADIYIYIWPVHWDVSRVIGPVFNVYQAPQASIYWLMQVSQVISPVLNSYRVT